ncbi:MAG: V-type ATP synthase subunit A [Promethearchaeota archaeon]
MTELKNGKLGKIFSIDGPIVGIEGFTGHKIGDLVKIGHKRMMGEIIKIFGDKTIAQCYEFTDGLGILEPVENTGSPLIMELAPGLIGNVFDGMQKSLELLNLKTGPLIQPGIEIQSLSKEKKWHFKPKKKVGSKVSTGDIIGIVEENNSFLHKIMVPFGFQGTISSIVSEGDYSIEEEIYTINQNSQDKGNFKNNKSSFSMLQKWAIRKPRPYETRFFPDIPFIAGIRVLDLLFPISKGGTAVIPGGFGTGKTTTLHSIAKFSNVDVIIYVHCGERGIEMTEMLDQFPHIKDPRTGFPIMEKMVFIGQISNMAVSARETSIFSGLTIAEYFRDMGLHVALLIDSISRYVESLREISCRLEEMPAAGGYPAYMSTRIANLFERAGHVSLFGTPKRGGSITIVGTVSPPAGDFTEPVTKTVKRFVRAFWALDGKLAYSKHFPAMSWSESYSLYSDYLKKWWNKSSLNGWDDARIKVREILSQSDQLQNISLLIGKKNLPDIQQLIIFTADLIKQAFLLQNADYIIDRYSSPEKTLRLIELVLLFYEKSIDIMKQDIPLSTIRNLPIISEIMQIKNSIENNNIDQLDRVREELINQFHEITERYQDIL